MSGNADTIAVIFRVWRKGGDVIALMPYEPHDNAGRYCVGFQHLGQHSAADYQGVMRDTRPATEAEYAPLLRELMSPPYGYVLRIIKRRGRR